jgi:hypothetical protein
VKRQKRGKICGTKCKNHSLPTDAHKLMNEKENVVYIHNRVLFSHKEENEWN